MRSPELRARIFHPLLLGRILETWNRPGEWGFVGVHDEAGELEKNTRAEQAVVGSVEIGGAGEALNGAEIVKGSEDVEKVGLGAIGGSGGEGRRGCDGVEVLGGDVR